MFQNFEIIGNLGRDPEMRVTPAGKSVTSFSVAVNRKYTGANGQKVEETMWVRVSAWEKLAEVCNEFLNKGSKVHVIGRLNVDPETGGPRIWKKEDGTASASFEMTAAGVTFLSSRGENNGSGGSADSGDDIPF